jgi:hypothetical protein
VLGCVLQTRLSQPATVAVYLVSLKANKQMVTDMGAPGCQPHLFAVRAAIGLALTVDAKFLSYIPSIN